MTEEDKRLAAMELDTARMQSLDEVYRAERDLAQLKQQVGFLEAVIAHHTHIASTYGGAITLLGMMPTVWSQPPRETIAEAPSQKMRRPN